MGIILFILGIIFVILKVTHSIDWSWWLVALPFYGIAALNLVVVIIAIITGTIAAGILAGGKAAKAVAR